MFSWQRFGLLGLSLFWCWTPAVTAPTFEAPYLSRPVMDEAGLIGNGIDAAEAAIRDLRARSGVHMTVYIPSSLRGLDIESFSMTVAEQWKLGKKGQDKGLLLIIAPRERRMRMEVGYGLEGVLTDAGSRRMLDQVLRPYLQKGRPADGVIAVVGAISQALGLSPSASPDRPVRFTEGPRWSELNDLLGGLGFAVLVFFLVLMRLSSGGRRWSARGGRGPFGGGSFGGGGFGGGGFGGGGGWGGGGGGFGGGGASSSW